MGVAVEQQGREMKGLVAWVGVAVERQGREMKGLRARVGNKIATWLEHVPPERERGGGGTCRRLTQSDHLIGLSVWIGS